MNREAELPAPTGVGSGDLLGSTSLINSMYLRLLLVLETKVYANYRSGDAQCATKQTNQGTEKAANQTKNLF